jgi:hypothetical protein
LNPIELVWADVKQSVGAENVWFNLDEVAKKRGKRFSEFGIETGKKLVTSPKRVKRNISKKKELQRNTGRIIIRRSEASSDSDISENSDLSGVQLLDDNFVLGLYVF